MDQIAAPHPALRNSSSLFGQSVHTAYLLSRYPAVSHTFFLQEVLGLRARGVSIDTASINTPDRVDQDLSADEVHEKTTTYYLKGQSNAHVLRELFRIALGRPDVLLRGLKAAWMLAPWNIAQSLYSLFYLAEALLVGDWMKRRNLQHLHIHFSGPVASVGMITALAWRLPYSMTVHGPDEFFDQNEMALPQKIGHASFVICISDYCKSQLLRISPPSTWAKFHVVRLGILPSLAEHLLTPFQKEPVRLLCTGRLVGAKGQAILLAAAASLLARGHALHVTCIGDGADRRALEDFTDGAGIRKHVHFTGARTHAFVLDTLRESDIFVLPSFAEGVPVALMEAMAIGVPCISTFVAGIPELIRHERDGLLVPAGSVEKLADAIERMIRNSDERESFRRSARAHVLEHYNLPRNLDKLATVLAEQSPHAVRDIS